MRQIFLHCQGRKKVCGVASFSIWNYLTDCESGTKRHKSTAITTDSDGIDDDGILEDIVVTTTSASSASHREDKTRVCFLVMNKSNLIKLILWKLGLKPDQAQAQPDHQLKVRLDFS